MSATSVPTVLYVNPDKYGCLHATLLQASSRRAHLRLVWHSIAATTGRG